MAGRSSLGAPLERLDEVHSLMDRRKKLNMAAVETLSEYFSDGVLRSIRLASYNEYGNKEKVRLPTRMPRMMRIQLANGYMRGGPMGGSPVLSLFFVQQYSPIKMQC